VSALHTRAVADAATGGPALCVEAMSCGYGKTQVLHDVDLTVAPGEVVALLGPNGAGKTTLLLAIAGILPITKGSVVRPGAGAKAAAHAIARAGTTFVPERNLFQKLTVHDNLRVAGVEPDDLYRIFPMLERHGKRRAGSLSGGEQQMLSVGRALAAKPKLLLIDELSLGLAPLVVQRLLEVVREQANAGGPGVLLVEQHVSRALSIADRGYVLSRGRVAMTASSEELVESLDEITSTYLGS
jgi:branched-chain amino acid transport system ATP-binding protein